MKVDKQVVLDVAELSQLQVDNADLDGYADGMSQVLDLVEQMQSLDTEGVAPMSNPLDAQQQLRPDQVTEPDQREVFQKLAPDTENGFYLVPRVVE